MLQKILFNMLVLNKSNPKYRFLKLLRAEKKRLSAQNHQNELKERVGWSGGRGGAWGPDVRGRRGRGGVTTVAVSTMVTLGDGMIEGGKETYNLHIMFILKRPVPLQ